MKHQKNTIWLVVLLFACACWSCNDKSPDDYDELQYPDALLDLYYFGVGSEWVYLQENDSTSLSTFRLEDRRECTSYMRNNTIEYNEWSSSTNIAGDNYVSGHTTCAHSHPVLSVLGQIRFATTYSFGDVWDFHMLSEHGQIDVGPILRYNAESGTYMSALNQPELNFVSLTVPAGSFVDVIEISCEIFLISEEPRYYVLRKMYFQPGVGILRWEYEVANWSTSEIRTPYAWDLQSWDLK